MDKTLRTRMVIKSITQTAEDETLNLQKVHGEVFDANEFTEVTPLTEIQLYIKDKKLRGTFYPGQEIHVDFTPVE